MIPYLNRIYYIRISYNNNTWAAYTISVFRITPCGPLRSEHYYEAHETHRGSFGKAAQGAASLQATNKDPKDALGLTVSRVNSKYYAYYCQHSYPLMFVSRLREETDLLPGSVSQGTAQTAGEKGARRES